MKKLIRENKLAANCIGVLCLIGVPLVGWLPGPGGIPLLLTGLGILSIHNERPRKLRLYVQHHSSSLRDLVFPSNVYVQTGWDIVGLVLGVSAAFIFIHHWPPETLLSLFGTALSTVAGTILISNRGRFEKIKQLLKL